MSAPLATGRPLERSETRRRWTTTALHLLIVLIVIGGFASLWWVRNLPERMDEQQTIVVGQTRFAPDSEASVRVVVQDFGAGKPIAGARVKVSLLPAKGRAVSLYEGTTDESGSAPVRFHVPADAPSEGQLVVETESSAGRDRVEQPVTVQREYRLLLTTDKPLYQPGQTIHMRTLALSTLDLTPARGAAVQFLVQDPKGNKVYRRSVDASGFGVAAADFILADLVNQGDYKLSVSIGDTTSEKTVEVRPYVLPKFGVQVSTDRSFYMPGDRVEGVVQADYFFGKPVAGGQVQIAGTVWDVQRTVAVDLRGETDSQGSYAFAFDLPTYFAGSGLESGQAQFALEVTVIDQTDHAEQTSQVLPVAAQPLIIEAIAESGQLKPGVENIVYVLTSYPDGRPAPTQLQISADGGAPVSLSSGEYGLTEFRFTPQAGQAHSLQILAQDAAGLSARRQIVLESDYGTDSVLLRSDRAAYVVGETMQLVALTPVQSGDVYLDIVKAGQTLSTRSARVRDGSAEFAVDVSADMYGTLELHAYKVLLDGTIVRDTRVAVVDAPKEVDIAITVDRESYLPGETAALDLRTSGQDGAGVQTALGVAIVDESVFALQRQDPGFAKLYFMLEQELLEPFYQIKGFEFPASLPPEREPVRVAQDRAAKASWAGVPLGAIAGPVNSRPQKMEAARQTQRSGFRRIGQASAAGMMAAPLLMWVVALVALGRARVLKRSFGRLAAAVGILLFLGGCLAGGFFLAREALYRLDVTVLLIPVALVLGVGLLAFFVYAWVKGDRVARFYALLTLAWGALLLLLILASDQGPDPDEGLAIGAVVSALLIPGAYLFLGQGQWVQERRLGGVLSMGIGGVSALLAIGVLPGVLMVSTFVGAPMAALDGEALMERGLAAPGARVLETMVVEKEVVKEVEAPIAGDEDQAAGEAPRLRQFFPETLFWAPEVATDQNGYASLQVPMADSITTWRLTALASSQDGRLGFTTRGIRVFQDFFVDIDLPVSLTQGDEISIPVGVYNYLPEAQEVRLVVEQEPWFDLLGQGERTLTIASNDIEVVYFSIRVLRFGQQGFQVTAWGSEMSDAIRRQVRVMPDGKEIRLTESNWLRESKEVVIDIPADVVPETPRVEVKIYPGVMAQVIEGLEKILRLPHG